MKIKHFLSFIVIILLFNSCSANYPHNLHTTTRTEYALGTIVTVKVMQADETSANHALDKAFERLSEIERVASAKMPESELFYVNQNAFLSDITVSEELFSLLKSGLFYSELTGGAFDITLGSLIELWNIGNSADIIMAIPEYTRDANSIPAADEIAEALENSGFEELVLNEENRSVRFLKQGLKLDLGAIAKGYAANEMKRVLHENNIKSALLDLGGDIAFFGNSDENQGNPWVIGLTDPLNPAEICAKLRVSETSVVTSGDYERYFTYEGKNYHHIFDRNTGYPAGSGIISATVITENSMTADALSTAFFVMGAEKATEIAANIPEIGYILIDEDMNFVHSEGLDIEIIK